MKTAEELRLKFDRMMADLLLDLSANRTTLRLDSGRFGFQVDDVVAEALSPGEKSLRGQISINQGGADTARWIEHYQRILVQDDLSNAVPRPPEALMDIYGAKAQMLGPVVRSGSMVGWVSVHDTRGRREWTSEDIARLASTIDAVNQELDQA